MKFTSASTLSLFAVLGLSASARVSAKPIQINDPNHAEAIAKVRAVLGQDWQPAVSTIHNRVARHLRPVQDRATGA